MIMKKFIFAVLLAVLLFPACQEKAVVVQLDTAALKGQIYELMGKYNSALNAKDVGQVGTYLSDDLLYLGTDPSEFWNREAIIALWKQAFADTTLSLKYTVDKREIKVATDGNSAIVVEQFTVNQISPKIPVRFVYHLVKTENSWMIDFASVAVIPKNEDIAALNLALE